VYLSVTGLLWKHHEYDVFFEPGSEPQENAVIGTRMLGWKADDHAFERPIRYWLPADLSVIVDSLADLSDEKMRAHLAQEDDMSTRENIEKYFDRHLSSLLACISRILRECVGGESNRRAPASLAYIPFVP
jgi:hypothetical protein